MDIQFGFGDMDSYGAGAYFGQRTPNPKGTVENGPAAMLGLAPQKDIPKTTSTPLSQSYPGSVQYGSNVAGAGIPAAVPPPSSYGQSAAQSQQSLNVSPQKPQSGTKSI